jgi:hypothetical protein
MAGAATFADYGDPRALPMLEEAVARFEPDFTDLWSRAQLRELVDAFEHLGDIGRAERRALVSIDERMVRRLCRGADGLRAQVDLECDALTGDDEAIVSHDAAVIVNARPECALPVVVRN